MYEAPQWWTVSFLLIITWPVWHDLCIGIVLFFVTWLFHIHKYRHCAMIKISLLMFLCVWDCHTVCEYKSESKTDSQYWIDCGRIEWTGLLSIKFVGSVKTHLCFVIGHSCIVSIDCKIRHHYEGFVPYHPPLTALIRVCCRQTCNKNGI